MVNGNCPSQTKDILYKMLAMIDQGELLNAKGYSFCINPTPCDVFVHRFSVSNNGFCMLPRTSFTSDFHAIVRIISGRVPGSATDFHYDVWFRGWITSILYGSPPLVYLCIVKNEFQLLSYVYNVSYITHVYQSLILRINFFTLNNSHGHIQ